MIIRDILNPTPAPSWPTVDHPSTPAAPAPLPITRIRLLEGIGTVAQPVTQLVQDIRFLEGTPESADVSMTTFHRGRLLGDATHDVAHTQLTADATNAIVDALLGSETIRRGIPGEYRQVPLKDTIVVKWTGADGRELATRVRIDPTTGAARDAIDRPVVDAIRAWQSVTGITPALAEHRAAALAAQPRR